MRVICPHCISINNIPLQESYKTANCEKCGKSLLDTRPIELTTNNFDEVISNSDILVIVNFWAPWCNPCETMSPSFEKSAAKFPLKILFTKINTESQQGLDTKFAVKSIPTLIIFKDAKEVYRVVGALDENSLDSLVSQFM
ncbi:MAG: thioredoxin TrxC [Sulfurimonas sp.]|nr:thioredoxin TrxC [Sulfurimonas sp.]